MHDKIMYGMNKTFGCCYQSGLILKNYETK